MPDSAPSAENRPEGFNSDALRALNSLNFGPAWASGNAPAPKAPAPRFDDRAGDDRRSGPGGDRRDRRGFDRPRREFTPTPAGERPASAEAPRAFEPRGADSRPPRRDNAGRPGDAPRGPRRDDRGAPQGGERRGPRPEGGERRDSGERREFTPRPAPFRPVVESTFYPEEKPFGAMLKTLKDSCRTVELFEIAKSILEKLERFQISVKPVGAEKNPELRLFQSVPDNLPFLTEAEAADYAFAALADTLVTTETVEVEPPKGAFSTIARCGLTGEFIAPPNYHGYQKALREHHAAKVKSMPFERFVARVETVKDEAAVAAWLEKKKSLVRYVLKDRKETDPEHFDSLEAAKAHLLATRKDAFVKSAPFVRFAGKDAEKIPAGPLRESIEQELEFQRKFPLDTANAIRGRLRKAGFALYKRGAKGVTFICGVKRKFRTPSTPPFADAIAKVFDTIERHQDAAAGRYLPVSELGAKILGPKPEGEDAAYEAALVELAGNLRYLVTEGYVTEFADGRLFALPVQTEAAAKAAAAEDAGHAAEQPEKAGETAESQE